MVEIFNEYRDIHCFRCEEDLLDETNIIPVFRKSKHGIHVISFLCTDCDEVCEEELDRMVEGERYI